MRFLANPNKKRQKMQKKEKIYFLGGHLGSAILDPPSWILEFRILASKNSQKAQNLIKLIKKHLNQPNSEKRQKSARKSSKKVSFEKGLKCLVNHGCHGNATFII